MMTSTPDDASHLDYDIVVAVRDNPIITAQVVEINWLLGSPPRLISVEMRCPNGTEMTVPGKEFIENWLPVTLGPAWAHVAAER